MNFDQLFEPRLDLIRSENRYRVFADLERRAPVTFLRPLTTACRIR